MSTKLTHIDQSGHAQMVNVGEKPVSTRIAIAKGEVIMKPETLKTIQEGALKKGDLFSIAKIAGVMAAKKTSELIPLCHPLVLDHISVELVIDSELPGIQITSKIQTSGKTGVEMEALTAVSVSALTIYDMAKAVEKTMCIQNIRLVEKHGGTSGGVIHE